MANTSIFNAFERMWQHILAALGDKQKKHIASSVSLSVSNWSNLSQTVTVNGVTASNTITVTPDPNSFIAYGEFGIYCSAQANGTLTFKCSQTPTAELMVNVMILD